MHAVVISQNCSSYALDNGPPNIDKEDLKQSTLKYHKTLLCVDHRLVSYTLCDIYKIMHSYIASYIFS